MSYVSTEVRAVEFYIQQETATGIINGFVFRRVDGTRVFVPILGGEMSDSDLIAIANLNTTEYGRSFLELADPQAARELVESGSRIFGYTTGNQALLNNVLTNVATNQLMLVEANTVYQVIGDVYHNAHATPKIKIDFTTPPGCLLTWNIGDGAMHILGESVVLTSDGTNRCTNITGTLVVGGDEGEFNLRAAKNTADANPASILLNTSLELRSP